MKKQRESGIEMLKIIAMFLIVVSHITQTLYSDNDYYSSFSEYIIHNNVATRDIKRLFLTWISSSGSQGNLFFFVCSSWFLLESQKINFEKIIRMVADVWIINIIFLTSFFIGDWFDLSVKDIIKSIFPTTFALNWYITCYILFYLIHTSLNKIISDLPQRELLTAVLVMFTMYYGVDFLHRGHFFTSSLIEFVVIYFVIAYLKKYVDLDNRKRNFLLLLVGVSGTPVLILITNYIGLHIELLQDKLSRWNCNCSPFILLTAISLFNIFRTSKFTNKFVNDISSMTLLIYIIHENYLFRTYIRPLFWIYFYNNFDYSYFLMYDLIQSVILFAVALLLSFLYKISLQKLIYKLSSNVYNICLKFYDKHILNLMKIT